MPTNDEDIHLCDVDTSDAEVTWACPVCGFEWAFDEVSLAWKVTYIPPAV